MDMKDLIQQMTNIESEEKSKKQKIKGRVYWLSIYSLLELFIWI